MTNIDMSALQKPSPAGLSKEEKLVWILGDLMTAAENYFGVENPKREGHIYHAAIRILDEVFSGYSGSWLPIETHPTDEFSHSECLIAGKYPNGVDYVEESYRHYDGHWSGRRLEPPTHWMPLPAPPQDCPVPAKPCDTE